MSKHHKRKNYGTQFFASPREGLTLEILAQAEKAGAKAGYAIAKEQLYRDTNGGVELTEEQSAELLAAAERAGAASALVAARKVLDKALRTSAIPDNPQSSFAQPPRPFEKPRKSFDQHVLTITSVEKLNPQIVRVIASAPNLDGYRSNGALDEYVKVFVADPRLGLEPPYDLRALRQRLPRTQVPRSKSYTIHWIDTVVPEIAIDFVVHGEPGTVGHWASTVQPGDPLVISPGRSKHALSLNADYFVLAADEAGLPAICKVLEALPATAQGIALIEVTDQQSVFDVKHPSGVVLRWLSRGSAPAGRSNILANAMQNLSLPHSDLGVIVHAERTAIKEINRIVQHWNVDKRSTHISSYWTLRGGEKRH